MIVKQGLMPVQFSFPMVDRRDGGNALAGGFKTKHIYVNTHQKGEWKKAEQIRCNEQVMFNTRLFTESRGFQ